MTSRPHGFSSPPRQQLPAHGLSGSTERRATKCVSAHFHSLFLVLNMVHVVPFGIRISRIKTPRTQRGLSRSLHSPGGRTLKDNREPCCSAAKECEVGQERQELILRRMTRDKMFKGNKSTRRNAACDRQHAPDSSLGTTWFPIMALRSVCPVFALMPAASTYHGTRRDRANLVKCKARTMTSPCACACRPPV